MNKIKKQILLILSFLILFSFSMSSFLTSRIYAQDANPWYMQTYEQWYLKVYDQGVSPPQEIFGERYTAAQVTWVIYGLISFFQNATGAGTPACIYNNGNLDDCIRQDPLFQSSKYDRVPLPDKGGVLAYLFPESNQLSGVNYVKNTIKGFSLISTAQAQVGFGFRALGPVQNIWRIFRDIMYGFFVLIIIVYAFMIMFRVKLNPQTVVSVQSSIPKIVMTLLLVTFSYAIAGFMIDLIYVVIGLLALVVVQTGLFGDTSWRDIFVLLTDGPHDGILGSTIGFLGWLWAFLKGFFPAVVSSVANISQLGAGWGIVAAVVGFFILIGLIIFMVVTTVRVFVLLVKTYLSIFISVIFSPFIIGFGSLFPTGGFGGWLKSLIGNLAVYPIVGAMMVLAVLFLSGVSEGVRDSLAYLLDVNGISNIFASEPGSQFWYPPLTFGSQNQAGNWDPLPILWLITSIGIISMIPKTADIIKSIMAGKGVEGAGGVDLFGKGGAFAVGAGLGLGAGRMVGGYFGRNVTTPFVFSQARKVEQGAGGLFSRSIASWGVRRGYIEAPSADRIRRRGTWQPRQQPPADRGGGPQNPNN